MSPTYLGEIPVIWWEYDTKINDALVQQQLAKNIYLNNSSISIDTNFENIDKTSGNYIIINAEMYDDYKKHLEMNLYSGENLVGTYKITLKNGNHDYIIRISTLVNWYTDKIDTIKFTSNSQCNIHEVTVSKADTIK